MKTKKRSRKMPKADKIANKIEYDFSDKDKFFAWFFCIISLLLGITLLYITLTNPAPSDKILPALPAISTTDPSYNCKYPCRIPPDAPIDPMTVINTSRDPYPTYYFRDFTITVVNATEMMKHETMTITRTIEEGQNPVYTISCDGPPIGVCQGYSFKIMNRIYDSHIMNFSIMKCNLLVRYQGDVLMDYNCEQQ